MMNLKSLRITMALVLCLSLVACTQAQILTDLDLAAVAVSAVAAVPGLPAPIVAYATLTATALDCVAAAIQAGGTNAQVGLAITTCGLNGAAPQLPAGTPQTIINVIQAVVTAVNKVLNDQKTIQTALMDNSIENGGPGTGVLSFLGGQNKDKKFSLGMGGKSKVAKIRKTLKDAKDKLPVEGKK